MCVFHIIFLVLYVVLLYIREFYYLPTISKTIETKPKLVNRFINTIRRNVVITAWLELTSGGYFLTPIQNNEKCNKWVNAPYLPTSILSSHCSTNDLFYPR